jgi:hypothetical protein
MVEHIVEEKKNSTFCKHRFRGYETSGSPLRFMLRRSSLVECVSVLPGNRCLQNVEFFFLRQYVQPCLLNDTNFCFSAEVNFRDFERNDNSNKGTTARLNETIFGPKKSRPQYISAQKISTLFFLRQYVQPCLLKNPKYTFYTIKSSLKLA